MTDGESRLRGFLDELLALEGVAKRLIELVNQLERLDASGSLPKEYRTAYWRPTDSMTKDELRVAERMYKRLREDENAPWGPVVADTIEAVGGLRERIDTACISLRGVSPFMDGAGQATTERWTFKVNGDLRWLRGRILMGQPTEMEASCMPWLGHGVAVQLAEGLRRMMQRREEVKSAISIGVADTAAGAAGSIIITGSVAGPNGKAAPLNFVGGPGGPGGKGGSVNIQGPSSIAGGAGNEFGDGGAVSFTGGQGGAAGGDGGDVNIGGAPGVPSPAPTTHVPRFCPRRQDLMIVAGIQDQTLLTIIKDAGLYRGLRGVDARDEEFSPDAVLRLRRTVLRGTYIRRINCYWAWKKWSADDQEEGSAPKPDDLKPVG